MHAQRAVYKLNVDLDLLRQQIASKGADKQSPPSYYEDLHDQMKEKHSLLAIAYYNLGCQQEHLKEYYKSMKSYLTALQLERQKSQFEGGNPSHNSKPHDPLI